MRIVGVVIAALAIGCGGRDDGDGGGDRDAATGDDAGPAEPDAGPRIPAADGEWRVRCDRTMDCASFPVRNAADTAVTCHVDLVPRIPTLDLELAAVDFGLTVHELLLCREPDPSAPESSYCQAAYSGECAVEVREGGETLPAACASGIDIPHPCEIWAHVFPDNRVRVELRCSWEGAPAAGLERTLGAPDGSRAVITITDCVVTGR